MNLVRRVLLWMFDRFIIVDNRMGLESLSNSILRAVIWSASLLACAVAVASVVWILW